MLRASVTRVPAPDPPSHILGVAPAQVISLRALLPPRPLPTAPPEVRGARSPTRPLLSGAGWGWCARGLVLSGGGGEATPLSLGTQRPVLLLHC